MLFFEPRHQLMIEEAADRLAKGVDPGVVPERFLIGAVRTALDRRLARRPPDAQLLPRAVEAVTTMTLPAVHAQLAAPSRVSGRRSPSSS